MSNEWTNRRYHRDTIIHGNEWLMWLHVTMFDFKFLSLFRFFFCNWRRQCQLNLWNVETWLHAMKNTFYLSFLYIRHHLMIYKKKMVYVTTKKNNIKIFKIMKIPLIFPFLIIRWVSYYNFIFINSKFFYSTFFSL